MFSLSLILFYVFLTCKCPPRANVAAGSSIFTSSALKWFWGINQFFFHPTALPWVAPPRLALLRKSERTKWHGVPRGFGGQTTEPKERLILPLCSYWGPVTAHHGYSMSAVLLQLLHIMVAGSISGKWETCVCAIRCGPGQYIWMWASCREALPEFPGFHPCRISRGRAPCPEQCPYGSPTCSSCHMCLCWVQTNPGTVSMTW